MLTILGSQAAKPPLRPIGYGRYDGHDEGQHGYDAFELAFDGLGIDLLLGICDQ